MTDDIKRQLWREGQIRLAESAVENGDVAEARRILRDVIEAGFRVPIIEVKDLAPRRRR